MPRECRYCGCRCYCYDATRGWNKECIGCDDCRDEEEFYDDCQPTELDEWMDFDPEC